MNNKLLLLRLSAYFFLILLTSSFYSTEIWAQCDDPTGLAFSGITDSSVDLSWDVVAAAENYRVAYRPDNTNTWTEIAVVATNGFSPTGLLSGTTYKWGVRTLCTGEQSNFIFGDNFTTTGPAACGVTTNLVSNVLNETNVQLDWDETNGATGYRVIYWIRDGIGGDDNQSTSPNAMSLEVSNNMTTLTGLQSGTTYNWTIRTLCADLGFNSDLADNMQFTTDGTVRCEDPTNLVVTLLTTTSVNLSWEGGNGAEQYRIGYKLQGEPEFTNVVTVSSTSLNVVNLMEGETYEWAVRVLCPMENTVSALVDGPNFTVGNPCDETENLSVSEIDTNSARFHWDPVTAAVSYTLQRRRTSNPAWTTFSGLTETTFLDANLLPGTDYEWQVRVICDSDQSSYVMGPEFTTLGESQCDNPAGHFVDNIMDNSADLSWDPAVGATGYRVSYRKDGTATWLQTTTVTETTFTPTGLVPGTTYEWAVRTICGGVPTESSLVFGPEFTTTGSVVCDDPTGLQVTNVDDASATLSWDAAAGAVNYRIAYRPKNTSTWEAVVTQSETTLDISGLTESTTYVWALRTLCSETQSQLIFGAEFTTGGGVIVCDDPTGHSTTNITTSSATLSWDAAAGAVNYRIAYREVNTSAWDAIIEQSGTTLNLAGLSLGTTYQWAVRTLCAGGETSNLVFGPNFTTTGAVVCLDPSNLQATSVGSTTATLSWDATPGAVEYRLAYRPVNTGPWENLITQPGTTYNATGLTPDTQYQWAVRALCLGTSTSDLVFGNNFTTTPGAINNGGDAANQRTANGGIDHQTNQDPILGFDELKLYPNPSGGLVKLEFSGTIRDLEVYNSLGVRVLAREPHDSRVELDLGNYGKGLYIIRVISSEGGSYLSRALIVQ